MLHNMAMTGYLYILVILMLCMVLAVMVVQTLPAKDEVWLAFWNWKEFPILGSPQNSCLSGSREVTCPSNVSCTNWV